MIVRRGPLLCGILRLEMSQQRGERTVVRRPAGFRSDVGGEPRGDVVGKRHEVEPA